MDKFIEVINTDALQFFRMTGYLIWNMGFFLVFARVRTLLSLASYLHTLVALIWAISALFGWGITLDQLNVVTTFTMAVIIVGSVSEVRRHSRRSANAGTQRQP